MSVIQLKLHIFYCANLKKRDMPLGNIKSDVEVLTGEPGGKYPCHVIDFVKIKGKNAPYHVIWVLTPVSTSTSFLIYSYAFLFNER